MFQGALIFKWERKARHRCLCARSERWAERSSRRLAERLQIELREVKVADVVEWFGGQPPRRPWSTRGSLSRQLTRGG